LDFIGWKKTFTVSWIPYLLQAYVDQTFRIAGTELRKENKIDINRKNVS